VEESSLAPFRMGKRVELGSTPCEESLPSCQIWSQCFQKRGHVCRRKDALSIVCVCRQEADMALMKSLSSVKGREKSIFLREPSSHCSALNGTLRKSVRSGSTGCKMACPPSGGPCQFTRQQRTPRRHLLKKQNVQQGRGGLWGCQMLRIPHCLDNRRWW
jgi:hypothetical protein